MMVISKSGQVAGVNSITSGNCQATATLAQANIIPHDRKYKITCKKSCHEVKTEVKYVKTEIVVVGCAEGKTIAQFDFNTTKLKMVCGNNYELKKKNITTLVEPKDGEYKIGMKEIKYCAKRVN